MIIGYEVEGRILDYAFYTIYDNLEVAVKNGRRPGRCEGRKQAEVLDRRVSALPHPIANSYELIRCSTALSYAKLAENPSHLTNRLSR